MDLKEIKQIVDLMKRAELSNFEIEEKDFKLRLSRGWGDTPVTIAAGSMPAMAMPGPPLSAAAAAAREPEPAIEDDPAKVIRSPMVGTFYVAPSPDSPSFVKVGDRVEADSVVCIIEAMKVMNEIKAEVAGEVAEVCLANGDSVEFGQPLFKLK